MNTVHYLQIIRRIPYKGLLGKYSYRAYDKDKNLVSFGDFNKPNYITFTKIINNAAHTVNCFVFMQEENKTYFLINESFLRKELTDHISGIDYLISLAKNFNNKNYDKVNTLGLDFGENFICEPY